LNDTDDVFHELSETRKEIAETSRDIAEKLEALQTDQRNMWSTISASLMVAIVLLALILWRAW
jgi:hypothetical protein